MADLNKKFLDYGGLSIFLSKLQEYIADRITEINGGNLNLYPSGTAKNPTITSQIEELWQAIGNGEMEGGTIIENIEKILGEYVKNINEPALQELPLKIQITEGSGDDEGRFTIGLVDNGLKETIEELSDNRVSKLKTPANPGGIATLSIDKSTGEVQLTLNTEDLKERLETIENGRIKSVTKGTSVENLVQLGVSTTDLNTTISIDDTKVKEEFDKYLPLTGGWLTGNLYIGDKIGFMNGSGLAIIGSIETESIKIGTQSPASLEIGSYCDFRIEDYCDFRIGSYCDFRMGSSSRFIMDTGFRISPVYGYGDGVEVFIGDLYNTGDPNKIVLNNKSGISVGTDISIGASGIYVGTGEIYAVGSISAENISAGNEIRASKVSAYNSISSPKISVDNGGYFNIGVDTAQVFYVNATSGGSQLDLGTANTIVSLKGSSITASGAAINSEEGFIGDLQGNATSASDSDKLDGHDSSYFATKEEYDDLKELVEGINTDLGITTEDLAQEKQDREDADTALDERITTIEDSYVKSVTTSNANTGTQYVTIEPMVDVTGAHDVTITINDSTLSEKIVTIDNYTINSKKISTSPTLTGGDITLGVSVGDNTNYPTTKTISSSIQKLRETIAGLGQVMELKGILTSLPTNTTGYENGDVVIVGNKEYVCYNNAWHLIGDVTELAEDVETLINKYNAHKHSVTAKGSVESIFTGDTNTTSSITGMTNVSYISKAGTLPTTTSKTVASSGHTHTTSVTAKGSVESTFTGTAASHGHTFEGNSNTTSNSGGTATYSAGKLTINFGHTHTVTPTGTVKNTSITPSGTVSSKFTGEAVSCASGAPSATTEFNAVSSVGTLPTYDNIEVASNDHTHTVTSTGTVASTFTGEAVTTGTTDSSM